MIAGMLPTDFEWAKRWERDTGPNAIQHHGETVAYLDSRIDGSWFATLDVQRRWPKWPDVRRSCSSYEAGRAGCELWVARHANRLRAEVAALPPKASAYWTCRVGRSTG